jgi:hypothetical protein
MDHGDDQAGATDDHGGGVARSNGEHGAGPARSTDEHAAGQAADDHSADQTGAMAPDEMMGMGHDSFLGLSPRLLTVATGYVALGLLGVTLLIGPANLLLGRRNPVSSYLRRDVGTWAVVFSAIHVVFGFQVEGSLRVGDMLSYFVVDGSPVTNSFGLGNWTGLAALVIVVGCWLFPATSPFGSSRQKPGRRSSA